MVQQHIPREKVSQAANDNAMRVTSTKDTSSDDGSCPLYNHVLLVKAPGAENERQVHRVQQEDSTPSDTQDKTRPSVESSQGDRPKGSLIPLFQASMNEDNLDPTTLICLDRAGYAFVMTEAHPPQRLPGRCILKRRFLTKLINPKCELDLRDLDAEDNSELEDCLFDFERARNTPGAPRHGRNKGSSNGKRRRTSTAPGSAKRRKQSTHSHVLIEDEDEDFELDIVDVFEGVKTELKGIRVDQLQDYYIFAFRSMSQLSNKDIAKTWIRAGHPKKQSKYPYNGGRRARQSLPAGHAYKGHFTKPDWWPSDLGWDHPDGARGCRHREPDHIKKLERLILLIHLLRYGAPFTIELMKESTSRLDPKCSKNFPLKTMKRLEEIYRVREQEIRYERGEFDGSSLVYVHMPKETAKRKASKVKKTLAIKAESPPPNSSVKQIVPAPVADMGVDTSLNAAPLDMDDEDNGVAVSVGVDSSDDTDPSVSEGRLSSVVDDVIPDAVEVLLAQYETRAPSHGLPLPAQMEQNLPYQPFERFGSTVGSSFVRSTQSDLPIADQYREMSEQAAHGQGSTFHPQEARIHRVPTSRKRRIGMLPQDVSSFILPSTTSGTTHKNQQRTQIHGRRMNVVHRPSRIRNHNAVRATQVPAPQPSPPPRPSAPKVSSFGGSSSGFSGLDSMNPSWAADVFWNNPQNMEYNSVYTEVADPNALFTSSANTSFSSESTDSSFEGQGSGLHMDYQIDPSQMFIPSNLQEQRAQDEFLRQQYSTFLSSSIFDTSSADPAMQMYPYPYTGPGSMADASMGFETKYNHFAPGPERQR